MPATEISDFAMSWSSATASCGSLNSPDDAIARAASSVNGPTRIDSVLTRYCSEEGSRP